MINVNRIIKCFCGNVFTKDLNPTYIDEEGYVRTKRGLQSGTIYMCMECPQCEEK